MALKKSKLFEVEEEKEAMEKDKMADFEKSKEKPKTLIDGFLNLFLLALRLAGMVFIYIFFLTSKFNIVAFLMIVGTALLIFIGIHFYTALGGKHKKASCSHTKLINKYVHIHTVDSA